MVRNLKEAYYLGVLDDNINTFLKETECASEKDPVAIFCEQGNELSGSIKFNKFLNKLSDHQLFNNNSLLHCLIEDNN
jgi:hypothetical protein